MPAAGLVKEYSIFVNECHEALVTRPAVPGAAVGTIATRVIRGFLLLVAGGWLAACSSGSSSSSSTQTDPDTGQAPDPVVIDFPIAYVKRPLLVDVDGNPLGGVEVTAELTDDAGLIEELQTTSVSVTSDTTTGTYALLFLAPGTYDVTAVLEGITFETPTVSVTVGEAEDVTGIDFAEAADGG